jgi:hypothetical protein
MVSAAVKPATATSAASVFVTTVAAATEQVVQMPRPFFVLDSIDVSQMDCASVGQQVPVLIQGCNDVNEVSPCLWFTQFCRVTFGVP